MGRGKRIQSVVSPEASHSHASSVTVHGYATWCAGAGGFFNMTYRKNINYVLLRTINYEYSYARSNSHKNKQVMIITSL